ncbi:DUF1000-domain-containing protein [Auriscalpium vulgare]|uniref:DUF1000-domain-containing protein n=1 Tax=Auriscalpium vulgare TaxID=40419 RepID=A0ACB8RXA1_9AGAM|nr:DUF1000-domain-containing protein [Auriscalpium vulgare]
MSSSEISLLEHLDSPQSNCLNEVTTHSLKSILASKSRNTSSEYLLSDADEQLLLNIHFNQLVRVKAIVLQSSKSSTSQPSQGPKLVKLFVNRPSLGFEDVQDADEPEAAQVFDLTEDQVESGKPIVLRYVRFQAVNSLHIFVVSNQGDEEATRIDAVDILGSTVEGTKDLSGLKKQNDDD